MKLKEVLQNPDSFTTTIIVALFSHYGPEFMEWDPETVGLRLEKEFDINIDQMTKDKVQAGATVMTTSMFYKSFNVFSVVCNVMSLTGYSTEMLIPPESDEVAWGCTEVKLLDKDYSPEKFIPEIKHYTGIVLDQEGVYSPPGILSFAEYPDKNPLTIFDRDDRFSQMFSKIQSEKKEEFNAAILNRMDQLMEQLENLDADMDKTFVESVKKKLTERKAA